MTHSLPAKFIATLSWQDGNTMLEKRSLTKKVRHALLISHEWSDISFVPSISLLSLDTTTTNAFLGRDKFNVSPLLKFITVDDFFAVC